jgi:hypothetical protein
MMRFLVAMSAIAIIAVFVGIWVVRALAEEPEEAAQADPSHLSIPTSIRKEHEKLLSELDQAVEAGGTTGAAAVQLRDVLMPHFAKEEAIALPPLGALLPCAEGRLTSDRQASVRSLSARLQEELPSMLREHQSISGAVSHLHQAASRENKQSVVKFAEELSQHAQNEEQVLYPAAILVGQYEANRPPP